MKKGGKREGSGRPKAEHKTEVISFRVRKDWAENLKKSIRELIKELKTI